MEKLLLTIADYNRTWNKDRDAAFEITDRAQHHTEYELVRHFYGARWSEMLRGPIADAVEAIEEVEFGELEDFYPEEECSASREEAWTASRDDFARAVRDLVTALERGLVDDAETALETLSAIESVWGDDPATRSIRAILDR